MKFRNPKTKEIFDNILLARTIFCFNKDCTECPLPSVIKPKLLPNDSQDCDDFCENHPIEAAHLMGYEIIPELGDDTSPLDTVAKAFNQIGKEANMDKPRICEVLGVEVGEEFTYNFDANRVNRSTFKIGADGKRYYKDEIDTWYPCYSEEGLSVIINHPDRIIRMPRFTQQDIEDAKMIRAVFGKNGIIKRYDKATTEPYSTLVFNNIYINENMFSSIKEGQEYSLDEIIGSETQL